MSKKSSLVVILCEDTQHEVFVRRFLKKASGLEGKMVRVVKNPSGKGSGEQFVRERFPIELKAVRRRSAKTDLIVVIDADMATISQIEQKLDTACSAKYIEPRQYTDGVSYIIPKRNIETWIRYLDGDETNEESLYQKLQRESDCQSAVDQLYFYCIKQELPPDFPDSLRIACKEYKRIER